MHVSGSESFPLICNWKSRRVLCKLTSLDSLFGPFRILREASKCTENNMFVETTKIGNYDARTTSFDWYLFCSEIYWINHKPIYWKWILSEHWTHRCGRLRRIVASLQRKIGKVGLSCFRCHSWCAQFIVLLRASWTPTATNFKS